MVTLHVCVEQADIQKYLIRSQRPWKKLYEIQAGLVQRHISSPRRGGRRSSSITVSDQ